MRRTKQEWIDLAKKRTLRVLATRQCCPIRMLEAKICEAGPGDKRPNPVSLTEAIRGLAREGSIQVIPKRAPTETPFYAPNGIDISSHPFKQLLAKRRALYLVHKSFTEQNEFCGDVLEKIVDTALERSGVVVFRSRFPDQNLPPTRPLDFVVQIRETLFGGEVKNFREWLYPDSWEIWAAISKCCELDALPVLIARKLPYVSFVLFGKAGMVGYQTHFQFFHPAVEPELARVKSIDGLGYKDIRCTLEPDGNMIKFFQTTLPKIAPLFKTRFAAKKKVLQHFADGRNLANRNLHPRNRTQNFSETWKAIVGDELPEDLHL
jgi:hypothetical protein